MLDCDTGTDDAVAIMLAALHPALDLVAVTTVHGNHPVAETTDHTLRVLAHLGRRGIEVYAGSDGPCAPREAGPDPRVLPPLALPPTSRRPATTPAPSYLAGLGAGVTLVCTGPLSNLALALELDPDLPRRLDRVVVLGGSDRIPSATPLAERNTWSDPVALQRVLAADFADLTMVPLDATHQAQLSGADADALERLGTPAGTAAAAFLRERIDQYGEGRAPVHDPVAVALLVQPGLVRLEPRRVGVELAAGPAYGRTEITPPTSETDGGSNALVAVEVDRRGFVELLLRTFA